MRKRFACYDQADKKDEIGGKPVLCKKFTDPGSIAARNDYPLYRYADVLLMYAEALARKEGKPTDRAMELVNMVRRRAYGFPPTNPNSKDYSLSKYSKTESFIFLVLQERGWETFGEGKRWFDLKRIGLYRDYIKKTRGMTVAEKHLLWPVPDAEYANNMGIEKGDQNPGYTELF